MREQLALLFTPKYPLFTPSQLGEQLARYRILLRGKLVLLLIVHYWIWVMMAVYMHRLELVNKINCWVANRCNKRN